MRPHEIEQKTNLSDVVFHHLEPLRREHKIQVLLACEAGSRAWGFPSRDSDYDVRFIYCHPVEWYFHVRPENQRSQIDFFRGDFDFVGWDLRKALWLMTKSNPNLLEWAFVTAELRYLDYMGFGAEFAKLARHYYTPMRAFWHYMGMAKRNYREFLLGDSVKLKKYLYVIRPIMCAEYIQQTGNFPPVTFDVLSRGLMNDEEERELDEVLALKARGLEASTRAPRMPALSAWIEKRIEMVPAERKKSHIGVDSANAFFREWVGRVSWS